MIHLAIDIPSLTKIELHNCFKNITRVSMENIGECVHSSFVETDFAKVKKCRIKGRNWTVFAFMGIDAPTFSDFPSFQNVGCCSRR